MEQILRCRDLDLVCNFVLCGETRSDVLKKANEHLEFIHYMESFPQPLIEKAQAVIHEGDCEREAGEACSVGGCVL